MPQIPAHASGRGGDAGGAPPPGFGGGAFWEYQAELARLDPAALAPERRRELLELGFPDDGYDYIKHMKEPGGGGGSVRVFAARKPEAATDVRTVDALQLQLALPHKEGASSGAGADLLDIHSATREATAGVTQPALEAIRDLERAAREVGVEGAAGEVADPSEPLAEMVEEGDLEDDFVALAADAAEGESYADVAGIAALAEPQAAPGGLAAMALLRAAAAGGYSSGEESGEWEKGADAAPRLLDEQFANLELGYGEDDLGDLEEANVEETRALGARRLEDAALGSIFDEFLEAQSRRGQAYEPDFDCGGNGSAEHPRVQTAADCEAGVAVAPVAAEETSGAADLEDRAHARSILAQMDVAPEEDDRPLPRSLTLQPPRREEWDCESVLSLRSNLDNHPGTIETPSGRPRKERAPRVPQGDAAGGSRLGEGIRLSSRHGIAVDYLERGGGTGVRNAERGRYGEGTGKAREKKETAEEKRARKAAVKATQREARASKKELKTLFKQGAQRQAALPKGPSVVPM